MNKQNKTVVKLLIYLFYEMGNQFHAVYAGFMFVMLFLLSRGWYKTKCEKYKPLETSLSWFSSYINL